MTTTEHRISWKYKCLQLLKTAAYNDGMSQHISQSIS